MTAQGKVDNWTIKGFILSTILFPKKFKGVRVRQKAEDDGPSSVAEAHRRPS